MDTPEHLQRMHSTNRLLPVGSLRRDAMKEIFGGFLHQLPKHGRVITKTLAKEVCRNLREEFDMEDMSPVEEVTKVHAFLKSARKRKIKRPSKPIAAMDNVETLPYEADG